MIEQLILVRHGETIHNVAGIAQGWNDSALSENGVLQVQRLAERLRAYRMTAIYSSPLPRAFATAKAISEHTGLEIEVLDDLREMNCGRWEGRAFLRIREEEPELFRRWAADPEYPCPEGESHAQVRRRMESALRTIEAQSNGAETPERVIVVSHGTAIRLAATHLLGVDVRVARSLAQDNAAINLFVCRADRWVMKIWNDATHCEGGMRAEG